MCRGDRCSLVSGLIGLYELFTSMHYFVYLFIQHTLDRVSVLRVCGHMMCGVLTVDYFFCKACESMLLRADLRFW